MVELILKMEKAKRFSKETQRIFQIRIESASLIETMVASVILIVTFSVATAAMNNVFKGQLNKDAAIIESRFNKLIYLYGHEKIALPYQETIGSYELMIQKYPQGLKLEAKPSNSKQSKRIEKIIYYYDQ